MENIKSSVCQLVSYSFHRNVATQLPNPWTRLSFGCLAFLDCYSVIPFQKHVSCFTESMRSVWVSVCVMFFQTPHRPKDPSSVPRRGLVDQHNTRSTATTPATTATFSHTTVAGTVVTSADVSDTSSLASVGPYHDFAVSTFSYLLVYGCGCFLSSWGFGLGAATNSI